MYALEQIEDNLWQIMLPKPQLGHLPYARPNNVYVITGANPTLINAGHVSQHEALKDALEQVGVPAWRVERIVATSWEPDCIGGAYHFKDASLFAFSPDLSEPSDYELWQSKQRAERLEFARALVDFEGYERELSLEQYEALLGGYFDPRVRTLPVIPLRDGYTVRAGELALKVVHCPGPAPGHVMLHEAERAWLFSGDLLQEGMPERLASVQEFVQGLERVQSIPAKVLLPNRGIVDRDGAFTLKYAIHFLNSFVTNVPLAVHKSPTLLEFVARDLGMEPSDELRYVETLRVYHTLLEELGRARLLDVQGHGLARRYGVDLNDPRSALRR